MLRRCNLLFKNIQFHATKYCLFLTFFEKINGQVVAKELSDCDVIEIWRQGLKKSLDDVKGFAQYRLPSGMIRLIYTLKEAVNLADYILDPFFSYCKSILGT
jgi:hypothetical protein